VVQLISYRPGADHNRINNATILLKNIRQSRACMGEDIALTVMLALNDASCDHLVNFRPRRCFARSFS
jgi:hypothetical protein